MRAYIKIVCAIILLTGFISGSSGRKQSPIQAHLSAGDRLTVDVITYDDDVRKCYLESPHGIKTEFKPNDDSFGNIKKIQDTDLSQCRATINIEEDDDGLWTLKSEAEDGRERIQVYNITVSSDEGAEEHQNVEFLERVFKNSSFGATHTFVIPDIPFNETLSCHIFEPNGKVVDVMKVADGIKGEFNVSRQSKCAVSITVSSEDVLGDWMLISVGHTYSEKIERRLPFTIHIEHIFDAVSDAEVVREGNNFHIAAKYVRYKYTDTCRLLAPNGEPPRKNYTRSRFDDCSYTVFNVTMDDSGDWEITYGDKILYRVITRLTVLGPEPSMKSLEGVRKMEVGMPGQVITDTYNPKVVVRRSGFISGSSGAKQPPIQAHLNTGDRLTVQVITFDDDVRKCYLESPHGIKTMFRPYDNSYDKVNKIQDTDLSQCRATINIEENDDGLWTLKSEAADGTERIQVYNITVSSESDVEKHQHVEFLERVFKNSSFGATHTFYIPDSPFGDTSSCHIIEPNGKRIDIMKLDGDGIKGEFNISHQSKCAVSITVSSENVLGDWMLISAGHRYSEKIERRLPFTIHIEVLVMAVSDAVDVREGNNFYIAAKYDRHEYFDTCRLLAPNGEPPTKYYVQSTYDDCSYKVFNVTMDDSGDWEINYGKKILYRAITRLTVLGAPTISQIDLFWTKDRPVNETLGPENAVYCRLRSPEGFVVFDGFGRCNISLDRAMKSHEGIWKMEVGMPGQVLTDDYKITVVVQTSAPKPTVRTRVIGQTPDDIYMKNMTLSCYVESPDPIRFCKFRDPSGRILIAAEAVGESRYSWHGTRTNYTAGIHAHECGLRITNTTINDFGIWRCEIDTEGDIYYGFLTAKPLWIRDPEIAASIMTVPTLTADRSSLSSVAGDSVTMTCYIQAPIRYCYFRARNGTVFNVAPSASHDLAMYVGAGFEAGECGIRFPSLAASDSGYWSCHVGLLQGPMDPPKKEQRARIELIINDTMVIHTYITNGGNNERLTITAQVNNMRTLDYCRFVRIDGFGFTHANTPSNVENWSHLEKGYCSIEIRHPSDLDKHPWAVVARVRGQDTEVIGVSDIAFPPNPPGGGGTVRFRLPGAWIIVMSIGMCLILLASFIGPKKNREWTYARASALRNSFVAKKVQQGAPEAANNTAVAA